MTCTTCGRENPPHLTFCQECGQRLGPRIAPPTPPIGLGAELGAPDPFPATADPFGQAAPARPAAHPAHPARMGTSLGAGPPVGPEGLPVRPAGPPPVPDAARLGPPRACRVCATMNATGLRYCTSCGSTLDPPVPVSLSSAPAHAPWSAATVADPSAPPLPPAHAAHAAPAHALSGPAPASAAPAASGPTETAAIAPPIAPMRVMDLGAPSPSARPPSDRPRACGRCRGAVEPHAQFCKFCGAPLNDDAAPKRDLGARPSSSPDAAVARPNGGSAPPAAPAFAAPPTPAPPVVASAEHTAAVKAPVAVVPPLPADARTAVRGRLVVIAKSGADGASYPFGDTIDIGRIDGQIVVSEDPYLSPRHVRLTWTGGKLLLRDLGSTNGVYLRLVAARDVSSRGARSSTRGATARSPDTGGEVAVPLHDQDLILVGQQVLRFEIVSDGSFSGASSRETGFGPAVEHGTLLFGSPVAPRYARLSQRTVEGVTRDVYYLRKAETVLGRESGDVVFTEDPFLSRRHAAIRVLGHDGAPIAQVGADLGGERGDSTSVAPLHFELVDLGSSNGTFVRIRTDIELVPGDHFRVGQQLFRVDFEGTPGSGAPRNVAAGTG